MDHIQAKHSENVNILCRICARKVSRKRKNEGCLCTKVTAEVHCVYNIDVRRDEDGIHPKKLCWSCHGRLKNAFRNTAKRLVSAYISKEDKDHAVVVNNKWMRFDACISYGDCWVCQKAEETARPGRPKKRNWIDTAPDVAKQDLCNVPPKRSPDPPPIQIQHQDFAARHSTPVKEGSLLIDHQLHQDLSDVRLIVSDNLELEKSTKGGAAFEKDITQSALQTVQFDKHFVDGAPSEKFPDPIPATKSSTTPATLQPSRICLQDRSKLDPLPKSKRKRIVCEHVSLGSQICMHEGCQSIRPESCSKSQKNGKRKLASKVKSKGKRKGQTKKTCNDEHRDTEQEFIIKIERDEDCQHDESCVNSFPASGTETASETETVLKKQIKIESGCVPGNTFETCSNSEESHRYLEDSGKTVKLEPDNDYLEWPASIFLPDTRAAIETLKNEPYTDTEDMSLGL